MENPSVADDDVDLALLVNDVLHHGVDGLFGGNVHGDGLHVGIVLVIHRLHAPRRRVDFATSVPELVRAGDPDFSPTRRRANGRTYMWYPIPPVVQPVTRATFCLLDMVISFLDPLK